MPVTFELSRITGRKMSDASVRLVAALRAGRTHRNVRIAFPRYPVFVPPRLPGISRTDECIRTRFPVTRWSRGTTRLGPRTFDGARRVSTLPLLGLPAIRLAPLLSRARSRELRGVRSKNVQLGKKKVDGRGLAASRPAKSRGSAVSSFDKFCAGGPREGLSPREKIIYRGDRFRPDRRKSTRACLDRQTGTNILGAHSLENVQRRLRKQIPNETGVLRVGR